MNRDHTYHMAIIRINNMQDNEKQEQQKKYI